MLSKIEAGVRNNVLELFSEDEYEANKWTIENIFVQPVLYSTLLQYQTIYEQKTSVSVKDILSDDEATDGKKQAYLSAFADALNISSEGMEASALTTAIQNKLSIAEIDLLREIQKCTSSYSIVKNIIGGTSKHSHRSSPEYIYFLVNKFAAVVISEGLVQEVPLVELESQSITVNDMLRYKNARNTGNLYGYVDVYIDSKITSEQFGFSLEEGETKTISLPLKKWKTIKVSSTQKESVRCVSFGGTMVGFGERELEFHITGPATGTINADSYASDLDKEAEIREQLPKLDIEFSGLIPVELTIELLNGNAVDKIAESVKSSFFGGNWNSRIASLHSLSLQNGNGIQKITARVFVNPMLSKEIVFYGNAFSLSRYGMLDWIGYGNTLFKVKSLIDIESGHATSL